MKFLSWLWLDQRTSRLSSTTIRMWIFVLFFISIVSYLVFVDSQISGEEISILYIIAALILGESVSGIGKRLAERISEQKVNLSEIGNNASQSEPEPSYVEKFLKDRGIQQ